MFKPTVRQKQFIKILITGPSGAGATLTSLLWGSALGRGKLAFINTRPIGPGIYVGLDVEGEPLAFDGVDVDECSIGKLSQLINAAIEGGYQAIVIDSLSDAWVGQGGLLEAVNNTPGGQGWKKWGPEASKFHALIAKSPIHIIVTLRTKTHYAPTVGDNGKPAITKLAMAPIQTDLLEYEYHVVAELERPEDENVRGHFSKTVMPSLRGISFINPDGKLARAMLSWAEDGVDAPIAESDDDKAKRRRSELLVQTTRLNAQLHLNETANFSLEDLESVVDRLCAVRQKKGLPCMPLDVVDAMIEKTPMDLAHLITATLKVLGQTPQAAK